MTFTRRPEQQEGCSGASGGTAVTWEPAEGRHRRLEGRWEREGSHPLEASGGLE